MLRLCLLLCATVLLVQCIAAEEKDNGKVWVLIAAGSNGWMNYRHQADACHAYQIVKKHGVPEEQIVTMMYDDIAHNVENPTPGKIINRPGGPDVYQGVKIDYKGSAVTPKNFLGALTGQGNGQDKVIKSGPNDRIFVFFVDHGAPGLVAFPDSELHAKEWNSAIKQMSEQKKFAQMVIYLEACESGSMFHKQLSAHQNVYAMTASNPHESSFAVYFDEKRETYLGDVFSVKWLENSDSVNLNDETVNGQYKVTKRETNTSHVMEYGDMTVSSDDLSFFQAGSPELAAKVPGELVPPIPGFDAVSSRDVPLRILEYKMGRAHTLHDFQKYSAMHTALVQKKNRMSRLFEDIVRETVHRTFGGIEQPGLVQKLVSQHSADIEMDCYYPLVTQYLDLCRPVNVNNKEYMRNLFTLSNMCAEGIPKQTIGEAISHVCEHSEKYMA